MNPDSKLAINSRTGKKRYLTPKIYNNPIRMRTGGWQLIEEPVTPDSGESVMVNMPGMPLTISGSTSGTVSGDIPDEDYVPGGYVYEEKITIPPDVAENVAAYIEKAVKDKEDAVRAISETEVPKVKKSPAKPTKK